MSEDKVPVAPAETPGQIARERRPSRKGAWLAMGAVVVALTLLWLGSELGNPSGGTGAGESDDDDSTYNSLAAGKPAPLHYTLKDMNGVEVQLASFKGKVIVLNFWATWCGPCRAEIPSLVELQTKYAEDLVILGVEVDGPAEKVKPFATEMRMNYPVLLAYKREDVQDAYGPLWGIPVTVFVDRSGNIVRKHSGIASKEQVEQEIEALL